MRKKFIGEKFGYKEEFFVKFKIENLGFKKISKIFWSLKNNFL